MKPVIAAPQNVTLFTIKTPPQDSYVSVTYQMMESKVEA